MSGSHRPFPKGRVFQKKSGQAKRSTGGLKPSKAKKISEKQKIYTLEREVSEFVSEASFAAGTQRTK